LFNINRIQDLGQSEMTHNREWAGVDVTWLIYWPGCWRVASASTSACVGNGGGHFEHMLY